MRLIAVIRADFADKANTAAKLVDTEGGERAFTVALARPANPTMPAAYWCSWDFDATHCSVQAFRDRLMDQGLTQAETTPVAPGTVPASNRAAIFRGDQWTPSQVLAAVGLQTMAGDTATEGTGPPIGAKAKKPKGED